MEVRLRILCLFVPNAVSACVTVGAVAKFSLQTLNFSQVFRPVDDTSENAKESKHFQQKAFTCHEIHILTRNLQILADCDWFC